MEERLRLFNRNKPKVEKPKETWPEFIASMSSVLVIGLFIITFCLQAFTIPSSSMEKTLLIGDHVFVDRVRLAPETKWLPIIPYRDVRRGDIVVFMSPSEPGLHVVKRIIGIPGDRIRLENGELIRNGERVNEPFVVRTGTYVPYRDDFPAEDGGDNLNPEWRVMMPSYVENGELVVPPDRYFAMGDNRDWSLDSRFWGFIPRENVIGRPMFIYWSFEADTEQYAATGIGDRLANIAHVALNFFGKTRWSRMLNVVR